jgi:hypothetical protein
MSIILRDEEVYKYSLPKCNNTVASIREWAELGDFDIKFSFFYVYFRDMEDAIAYKLRFDV